MEIGIEKNSLEESVKEATQKKIVWILTILAGVIFFSTLGYLVYNVEQEIIKNGFHRIITSHAVLITDYLVIGGLGATFLNAFLILLFNVTTMKILGVPMKGLAIASIFTVFGFSFFGKNIINILPIYLGGILYAKYHNEEFKDIFIIICFTTALAPYISEVAFSIDGGQSEYISGVTLGVIIGFIITPISRKMAGFHEGFNLYNLGFTGGILGAVISSIMKAYHFKITPRRVISEHHHENLLILCTIVFLSLIIIGWVKNNRSFRGLRELMKDSGHKADYTEKYGYGITFVNMGLMGFVAVGYVMVFGETLNGPLLAGVLTIVGFSAYGKHMKNTIPILIGVWLASIGTTTDYFTVVLSALFGTSLAPVSGVYGTFWGIVVGWIHLSVVQSIGSIHGGLNLYNNGFSAGIVAGVFLPVMNTLKENKENRKLAYLKKKRDLYDSMTKFKEHLKAKD